jgi:hypothetical protein
MHKGVEMGSGLLTSIHPAVELPTKIKILATGFNMVGFCGWLLQHSAMVLPPTVLYNAQC